MLAGEVVFEAPPKDVVLSYAVFRCDAREIDVRNGGRWRSMEEMARFMAQGAYMSTKAREAAGNGRDPIFDVWVFRPVCISGEGGQDDL